MFIQENEDIMSGKREAESTHLSRSSTPSMQAPNTTTQDRSELHRLENPTASLLTLSVSQTQY